MNVKFMIIGAPRTGSTLLVKTLNSLQGVCCHGELLQQSKVRGYEDGFNHWGAEESERGARANRLVKERNSDPVGFLEKALADGTAATGFKVIYQDFLAPRWRNTIDALLEVPDIRFIHLKRTNSLRRYVSEKILGEGGPIHSAVGGRKNVKIRVNIDIPTYLERSLKIERESKEVEFILSGKKLHLVRYELLAKDTSSEIAHICQFLGLAVAPSDIKPALTKVGSANLCDAVTNYDELLANDVTRALVFAD